MRRSKPQPYSITSSARTSNEGGTVRPSALAVFMLMMSSNLVRLLYRQIGKLGASEKFIDVVACNGAYACVVCGISRSLG